MKIAIGSDHAGVELRRRVHAHLEERGHQVIDLGSDDNQSVDYPDYAFAVARRVAAGEVERGVLMCGTGIGMEIAANKVPGIRAALLCDEQTTRLSRQHNDTNIACFGGRTQDPELVTHLIDIWLATAFEGGRHAVRVDKIRKFDGSDPRR